MLNSLFWFLLIFTACIWDWIAVYNRRDRIRIVSKPLVTSLILCWFIFSGGLRESGILIGLGLLFSLLGDIALLRELLKRHPKIFMLGAGLFLFTHICYGISFYLPKWKFNLFSLFSLFAITFLSFQNARGLLKSIQMDNTLAKQKPTISSYIAVLSFMLFSAINTLFRQDWKTTAAIAVSLGAVLFYTSDSLLARNKFVRQSLRAEVFVMITYHLAQVCIAGGVLTHLGLL